MHSSDIKYNERTLCPPKDARGPPGYHWTWLVFQTDQPCVGALLGLHADHNCTTKNGLQQTVYAIIITNVIFTVFSITLDTPFVPGRPACSAFLFMLKKIVVHIFIWQWSTMTAGIANTDRVIQLIYTRLPHGSTNVAQQSYWFSSTSRREKMKSWGELKASETSHAAPMDRYLRNELLMKDTIGLHTAWYLSMVIATIM